MGEIQLGESQQSEQVQILGKGFSVFFSFKGLKTCLLEAFYARKTMCNANHNQ